MKKLFEKLRLKNIKSALRFNYLSLVTLVKITSKKSCNDEEIDFVAGRLLNINAYLIEKYSEDAELLALISQVQKEFSTAVNNIKSQHAEIFRSQHNSTSYLKVIKQKLQAKALLFSVKYLQPEKVELASLAKFLLLIIPLISFFSGLIYNKLLLYYFSISPDGYFSINDYASSIISFLAKFWIMYIVFFSISFLRAVMRENPILYKDEMALPSKLASVIRKKYF